MLSALRATRRRAQGEWRTLQRSRARAASALDPALWNRDASGTNSRPGALAGSARLAVRKTKSQVVLALRFNLTAVLSVSVGILPRGDFCFSDLRFFALGSQFFPSGSRHNLRAACLSIRQLRKYQVKEK
jgi:hypothetical protein